MNDCCGFLFGGIDLRWCTLCAGRLPALSVVCKIRSAGHHYWLAYIIYLLGVDWIRQKIVRINDVSLGTL